MRTQLPSKYPWKSSREPLGVREPRDANPCFKPLVGRKTRFVIARRPQLTRY